MGINEEQPRAKWRADLARIATRIDGLKARIETESRMLYENLSAEVAALQSDLENLQAEVAAARPDAYARQIATQIEELRAKGDAAYDLLRAGGAAQLDPTDVEIRRLEAAAATASEDARTKLIARIDELKAAWPAGHASGHTDDWAGQTGSTLH